MTNQLCVGMADTSETPSWFWFAKIKQYSCRPFFKPESFLVQQAQLVQAVLSSHYEWTDVTLQATAPVNSWGLFAEHFLSGFLVTQSHCSVPGDILW